MQGIALEIKWNWILGTLNEKMFQKAGKNNFGKNNSTSRSKYILREFKVISKLILPYKGIKIALFVMGNELYL